MLAEAVKTTTSVLPRTGAIWAPDLHHKDPKRPKNDDVHPK